MTWTHSCNERFGAVAVIDIETNFLVADLSDCSGTFEKKVERARLIAAAPELTEAASSLLSALPGASVSVEAVMAMARLHDVLESAGVEWAPDTGEEKG